MIDFVPIIAALVVVHVVSIVPLREIFASSVSLVVPFDFLPEIFLGILTASRSLAVADVGGIVSGVGHVVELLVSGHVVVLGWANLSSGGIVWSFA